MSVLKLGTLTLLGALLLGRSAPANARIQHPEGWKVRVSSRPFHVKSGLYEFSVSVRDAAGQAVDGANVWLRLHSFQQPGYRLVRARRAGKGEYQATARLHAGLEDPRYVGAVVSAAAN